MHADVLVVTVTKVESQAVLQTFQRATGQPPVPEPIGDKIYHNLGIVNGASVFMVQSEMGAGGLGAAQQTVQKRNRRTFAFSSHHGRHRLWHRC